MKQNFCWECFWESSFKESDDDDDDDDDDDADV